MAGVLCMKQGQGKYQSARCVVQETGTGDISEWQVCCARNWDREHIRVRCVVHETGTGDILDWQVC